MSENFVFQRRDFLKIVGLGVAATAAGCSDKTSEKLIPYLIPPQDVLVGVPYWYASTCRECPAGCGIVVKAREGRAIKIEGNPKKPLNQGGLCRRGHAALQALYDPDRVRTPLVKQGGAWKPISWDDGLKLAGEKLAGAKGSAALLTDHVTGSLAALIAEW